MSSEVPWLAYLYEGDGDISVMLHIKNQSRYPTFYRFPKDWGLVYSNLSVLLAGGRA